MKKLVVICLLLGFAMSIKAQDDEKIVMKIADKEITKREFERIYRKNNTAENKQDQKSLEEYVDLFVNFKLKVIEAENRGLDTVSSFVKELKGYRKQLSKPYFSDEKVDEQLIKEAYERMKFFLKGKHILTKVGYGDTPEDTLKAYNKIMKLRKRIIAGEDFEKVARAGSEDESVVKNGGNLGYFTAFSLVYPFEKAAYDLELNTLSKPVRTRFGYHLIMIEDKKPNPGTVKVAHIMKAVPKGSPEEKFDEAKKQIDDLLKQLKEGADFAELAKENSDDKGSARNGGEMRAFTLNQMVPEFEKAAFELKKIGEISAPVKTDFGWHIIKLLEKEPLKPFDDIKAEIKQKISKDARAQKSRKVVLARLKEEYNLKENPTELKDFYKWVTDSIFVGKWDATEALKHNEKLFELGDSAYTQKQFAQELSKIKRKTKPGSVKMFVDKEYQRFVDDKVMEYEDARLEMKYPDFKYLVKEYHDGILLFELTDQLVWSKAVKDSAGLADFYEKNKSNYLYGERYNISEFKYKDSKTGAKLEKYLNKGKLSQEEILAKLNEKDSTAATLIDSGLYEEGESDVVNELIKSVELTKKEMPVVLNNTDESKIIYCKEKVAPTPKPLKKIRGIVTADYQNQLEQEWVKELRAKYKVEVYDDVLKTIKP